MITITTGFGFRLAADPLVFTGEVTDAHLADAEELGGAVAWTLTL